MSEYNSITKDTLPHKANVSGVIRQVIGELSERAMNHDNSKLQSPELEMYNKYIPLLQKTKYGTPEYYNVKKQMEEDGGLQHHYKNNDHHPEHFENGIGDMNMIQLLELLCDWKAASMRSDTSFKDGLTANQKRFGFSDELLGLMVRTSEYFGW